MEILLKEVVEFLLWNLLFSPSEREKKKLMHLQDVRVPEIDRLVCLLYVVMYICWLLGSVWLPVWWFGVEEPTLFYYALCYLSGTVVTELLLWVYAMVVKRSVWQILASRSVKRDAKGRLTECRSVRWRWLLRGLGLIFLMLSW